MADPIFISVVVPTYNRSHLVGKTIDSILAQDYPRFELIVVDDGSTDNTEGVLKKYSGDDRFRYYKKENGERGAARNFGFNRSAGDYVFFIDSDDLMLPGHLIHLNNTIQSLKSRPDFLAAGYVIVNPDGSFNARGHSLKKGWYDRSLLLKGNPFACLIAVRKLNPDLVPFSEDRNHAVMEDWIFLVENLQNSRIYVMDEVTIRMVEHSERSMADNLSVISRRQVATNHLLDKISLTPKEKRTLKAYSHYFCAIHSCIEGRRRMTFSFLGNSFLHIPFNKSLPLLFKSIAGKQIVRWLKRLKTSSL
jgi:glycosyltransferase involved in cell wall biosynthesis